MFRRFLIPVQVCLGRFQLQGILTIKQVTCGHIHCYGLQASGSQLQKIAERDYIRDLERADTWEPKKDDYSVPERDGTWEPKKDDYSVPERDGTREPEKDDYSVPERDGTRGPETDDYSVPERDGTREVAHEIYIDLKKVQQHLKRKGIEVDLCELENNWQFLKDEGCLNEQLYCYPKILSHSNLELAQLVSRLRELGCEKISVGLLRLAMRSKKTLNKKKIRAYMKDSFKQSASVINVIGCDNSELESLLQKFAPAMKLMTTDPRKLRERIDLLCQNGYSVQEIIDCPKVLEKSVRLLSDRFEKIQRISRQEGGLTTEKLPLTALCHPRFDKYLPRLIGQGHLLADSQKLRKFAEMFQADENSVMLKRPVKQVSMLKTTEKISTLQEAGFSEKEIMCKSVILSYSNKSIKEAVEYIRQENKELSCDADHLSNVLQHKLHCRGKNHPESILKHIASYLDIDYSTFSKSQKCLIHKASFITVTENKNFLEQSGFSKDAIRSCPLILVQEFDRVWKSYLEVGNLENYKHFKENNVKFLNAMQYLIEFDSKTDDYFDSSVHVDLED